MAYRIQQDYPGKFPGIYDPVTLFIPDQFFFHDKYINTPFMLVENADKTARKFFFAAKSPYPIP
jgi:hypothetical protein